jgi:hypothetical protein
MKACAEFEQRGDTRTAIHGSRSGSHDTGEDLKKRALTGPILTDDTERFTAADFEIDILQGDMATRAESTNSYQTGEKAEKAASGGVVDRVVFGNSPKRR